MARPKSKNPFNSTTLGNYKVLRELGRGGMGVVYRGEQVSVNRAVTLKVLPASLTHDRSFVKRFIREGRVTWRD